MTGADLIQALEIPSPLEIIEKLSHQDLYEICGYGRNASSESLREKIKWALIKKNEFPDLERDLRNFWLAGGRR